MAACLTDILGRLDSSGETIAAAYLQMAMDALLVAIPAALIAILEALKSSGSLRAELVVI